MADAGLFRLWLPKAFGGAELPLADFVAVIEAVAALDGSVGWIAANGGGMSRAAGYLPEAVARRWFADNAAMIACSTAATGTAVQVDGGYRITGRWPFGSGILHATKVMGLCALETRDEPSKPVIACYMDRQDVSVIDTWFVSGLRGTGSCDFAAQDVFVPFDHAHAFPDVEPTQPGLVYRLPMLVTFPLTVSAVPLGIARGAIGHFVDLARTRSRSSGGGILAERETIQDMVGRVDAIHRSARALLIDSLGALAAAADQGGDALTEARSMSRAAFAHAADSALHVVGTLARAAGSAAIVEGTGLERCLRDVQAAVQHIAMSPNNYALAGRVRLGLPPGPGRF